MNTQHTVAISCVTKQNFIYAIRDFRGVVGTSLDIGGAKRLLTLSQNRKVRIAVTDEQLKRLYLMHHIATGYTDDYADRTDNILDLSCYDETVPEVKVMMAIHPGIGDRKVCYVLGELLCLERTTNFQNALEDAQAELDAGRTYSAYVYMSYRQYGKFAAHYPEGYESNVCTINITTGHRLQESEELVFDLRHHTSRD